METKLVIQHIVNWISNYVSEANSKGMVIGVSGGIDSAVTATLAAETGLQVLCVEMPIHQDVNQVNRAKEQIEYLKKKYANVKSIAIDLTNTYQTFIESVPVKDDDNPMALVNTRARLRMTTLYYFAALYGYLVIGTGNKIEDFGIGFFTKYGDGGVDFSPIADLLKSEVYTIGKELNVVESILIAPPTDGLWGDERTDEDQIGATYDELEWAMNIAEKGIFDVTQFTPRQIEVFEIYTKLNTINQHKMQAIPICVIPKNLK